MAEESRAGEAEGTGCEGVVEEVADVCCNAIHIYQYGGQTRGKKERQREYILIRGSLLTFPPFFCRCSVLENDRTFCCTRQVQGRFVVVDRVGGKSENVRWRDIMLMFIHFIYIGCEVLGRDFHFGFGNAKMSYRELMSHSSMGHSFLLRSHGKDVID